jgi:methylmalonyl-CoA mutase
MRSWPRATSAARSARLPDVIAACKVAGFDLVVVETSGIGQGDAPSCRMWTCRCT